MCCLRGRGRTYFNERSYTSSVIYAALVFSAAVSVTDVPNPTPRGWVSDMANVIDPAVEQQIDARIFALREATGHQVAVVTVPDVQAASPKAFSTALFNHWGIGSKERQDGLLILLVVGQRRLEMETGIGMESRLPEDWLQAMQQRAMVPRFKAGDYGGGIAAGLVEVDAKLRGSVPLEVSSAGVPVPGASGAPGGAPVSRDFLVKDPVTGNLVPAGMTGGHAPVAPSSPVQDVMIFLGGIFTLVAGGASSVFGFFWIGRRMRRCPKCRQDTILLDELADDKHLDDAQRDEERLGSVDYKVYVCPGCDFTRTAASTKWFSGYSACKGCRAKTLKSTSSTLTYATYDHGGTVQVNEACARCPYRNTYQRSTPRKTRSSSSSSSSRSSGSSFGGGRSRGGGSGSSW
jgi:uncharacterized protein